MHTHQFEEYTEGQEDDEIYEEEIEVDQNFTVSAGAGLTELVGSDVELLDEEPGPLNKRL
jgi:hypothetical protein